MDEIARTISTAEILMEKYDSLSELDALKLATQIEANNIAQKRNEISEDLIQTLAKAFVVTTSDNYPTAFENISIALNNIADSLS